jgi:hypothetical protein
MHPPLTIFIFIFILITAGKCTSWIQMGEIKVEMNVEKEVET